jgi:hypothetical protein
LPRGRAGGASGPGRGAGRGGSGARRLGGAGARGRGRTRWWRGPGLAARAEQVVARPGDLAAGWRSTALTRPAVTRRGARSRPADAPLVRSPMGRESPGRGRRIVPDPIRRVASGPREGAMPALLGGGEAVGAGRDAAVSVGRRRVGRDAAVSVGRRRAGRDAAVSVGRRRACAHRSWPGTASSSASPGHPDRAVPAVRRP